MIGKTEIEVLAKEVYTWYSAKLASELPSWVFERAREAHIALSEARDVAAACRDHVEILGILNGVLALVDYKVAVAGASQENLEAGSENKIRADLADAGKKPTDKAVAAMVEAEPTVQNGRLSLAVLKSYQKYIGQLNWEATIRGQLIETRLSKGVH